MLSRSRTTEGYRLRNAAPSHQLVVARRAIEEPGLGEGKDAGARGGDGGHLWVQVAKDPDDRPAGARCERAERVLGSHRPERRQHDDVHGWQFAEGIVTGTVRPAPVVTLRPCPVMSMRIGGD